MKAILKTISLILFITGLLTSAASATEFKNETLNYVISYKWGLVHKDAGQASLTLKNNGNTYNIILAGKTKPWADKLFQVRDTLRSTILIEGLKPKKYEKTAHENGKYSKDEISYSYVGNEISGHCIRTRTDKKGKTKISEKTFNSTGPTYDMLSVFYYLRSLDFATLTKGKDIKTTLFSGSMKETLTVRYLGKEEIKLRNKTLREAYHIIFNFTREGKQKSSDDLDAWISTDSMHIPLQIFGSLPLGQVRCYYIP